MGMTVDFRLIASVAGWTGIGLAIGGLTYAALVRIRPAQTRADLPLALILGFIGAAIGGATGWSMHGAMNGIIASLLGALIGALLLSVMFQFIIPV